jgi:PAS domain S-box-containing protein
MKADRQETIRALFEDYIQKYASRDDRLTADFSDHFSGYTGGGAFLVKNREDWVRITRQDFAQVPGQIGIELVDSFMQDLSDEVVVATGFFHIHLPLPDHVLSREVARLVLIFHLEGDDWKIVHSGISIPYNLVQDGEVYPLRGLLERNSALEALVAERTQALTASRALYRLLTEDASDVVWKTDQNLLVTYISPADERLRGYPAEEVIGHPLAEMFTEEGLAVLAKHLEARQHAERQGGTSGFMTFEAQHRCKDGQARWGEVMSKPDRDAQGVFLGYHGITRESTDRRRAEAEKARLEAMQHQLQKAESLGRMAGAIAHHFNNQLQTVMGSLEQVSQRYDPGGTDRALHLAKLATKHAADMSRLMLLYLGQTHSPRHPCHLGDLCLASLATLRPGLPAGVTLEAVCPSPGLVIMADPEQFHQVLEALLTNAWQAMDARGGHLQVRLGTAPAAAIPERHRFPVDWHLRDQEYVCLEVADNGCGIAEADCRKLFDPFFSTKVTGRGLGLPVVLGIMQAHDGGITVEGRPGQGSSFRLWFPVCAEPVALVPQTAEPAAEPQAGGTILLVDDDEYLLEATKSVIELLGFNVVTARDGLDALEVFASHPGQIRCVITDLTMPRLDGWGTLEALRALEPGLPVILASGFDQAQVMAKARTQRPQAFLAKPFDLKQLRAALGKALR